MKWAIVGVLVFIIWRQYQRRQNVKPTGPVGKPGYVYDPNYNPVEGKDYVCTEGTPGIIGAYCYKPNGPKL